MSETTNIEQRAFLAAQKTIQSKQELPLSLIDAKFRIVQEATFMDEDGQPAQCTTSKFGNLEQIKAELERTDAKTYVYKLYGLQEFGMDLHPTGNNFFHLRYCVRAKQEDR